MKIKSGLLSFLCGAVLLAPTLVTATTVSTWSPVMDKTASDFTLVASNDDAGALDIAGGKQAVTVVPADNADAIRAAISAELQTRSADKDFASVQYWPYNVTVSVDDALADSKFNLNVTLSGTTLTGSFDGALALKTGQNPAAAASWAALGLDAATNGYKNDGKLYFLKSATYVSKDVPAAGRRSVTVVLFKAVTPTPTSGPAPTAVPTLTPAPTTVPIPTPIPTIEPRPTEVPVPTETPLPRPTGTVQPTPAPDCLPTATLTGETNSGLTNLELFSIVDDPLGVQRADSMKNLLSGISGSRTSGEKASTSYGDTARTIMTLAMGIPVNGYTSNISVSPVRMIQGEGGTLEGSVSFTKSSTYTAGVRTEVFLALPVFDETVSGDVSGDRAMKGLEVIAPQSVSGTERTFTFTVKDNKNKDQNGVVSAIRTEYYLVRVAATIPVATPTGAVTVSPTSAHAGGGGGGCSAFGFAPMTLLLLAPLSLLRRHRK